MKKTNRALPAAAVALGAILLMGCPLFSPHGSFGRVRLSLGTGGGAKTILPVIEVDSYLIAFSGPAAVDPVSTTQANPTIELPVGTWDISVEGKDAGGDTVAVGGASGVVVSEGTTTPVAIVLNAQASGTGTIDVTVTWPVGVTPPIDADKTTVTLDEAADPGTLTFGSTWVRYVKAKPAGSYRLCLTLVSVATPRASVQEAVQVYGNLTSSATIALTSDDFLFPPTPPGGLAVAEGLGALELSWTDTSHVETGYVVERSTTGLPLDFYALGSPLPANTEGYHDADASASVTYWYRVKATNSLGDSGYSNVGSGKVEAPVAGASGALSFSATTTSSIRVSWVKATDNVSAQAVLEYRVVRSPADDVRTVAEALANGTVVLDWTPDVDTANATGLASGTAYYFNVLARDEAGNTTAWVSGSRATSMRITADHTIVNMVRWNQVPNGAIDAAKSALHIAIGHTSQGSQIINGLYYLDTFKGGTGRYAVQFDGNAGVGVLDISDNPWMSWPGDFGRDLGSSETDGLLVDQDYLSWLYTTRKYLGWTPGSGDGSLLTDYATGTPAYNPGGNGGCNVVIWAWCGQLSYCQTSDVTNYLANMAQLELDYPQVKFVYMTGHADGTGLSGNLHVHNDIIRTWCAANDKILYDFEDIESWDPDGNYFGDDRVSQAQNYDFDADGVTEETSENATGWWPSTPLDGDRNWALDWQSSHTLGTDWYQSDIRYYHAQHLGHNMKAYSFWWLMARIAGWDGQ